jgi:hypothetical protein
MIKDWVSLAISLISIALTVAQRQLNCKLPYLFDKYMPPSTIKNNTNLWHQVLFFSNAVANKNKKLRSHHHTELETAALTRHSLNSAKNG